MNVLFILLRNEKIREQINFINNIQNENNINSYIFHGSKVDTENLKNLKIKKDRIFNLRNKNNLSKRKIFLFFVIKYIFKTSSFYKIISEKRHIKKLNNYYKEAEKIINNNKINCIFLETDRGVEECSSFLKVAKIRNIPTIIPFYSIFADYSVMVKSKTKNSILSFYDIYMYFKFKKYKYQGKDFYPYYIINALCKFNTLSSNPWIMGNGLSKFVICNNLITYRSLKNNGVSNKKLRIIGDIVYDKIYHNLKNTKTQISFFKSKLKLDTSKKIIILALPQLAEDGVMSWKNHWEEIDFLCKTLDHTQFNIIVSLHPKMNFSKYEFLENKYKLRISKDPLSSIIHFADLFIATYSSTIIWSLLCNKSTIVIDFYNLDRVFFDKLESLKIVKKRTDLVSIVNKNPFKFLPSKKDLELLSFQKTFDGNVISRYIDLIMNK